MSNVAKLFLSRCAVYFWLAWPGRFSSIVPFIMDHPIENDIDEQQQPHSPQDQDYDQQEEKQSSSTSHRPSSSSNSRASNRNRNRNRNRNQNSNPNVNQPNPPPTHPPNNDGPSDDEDDAEENDISLLPPDHPLLAPVQQRLITELRLKDNSLTDELRLQTESLTRLTKQRESIGVQLYSQQQNLAKKQIELEKSHSSFLQTNEKRTNLEIKLKKLINKYREQCNERNEIENKKQEAQKEYDSLQSTLQSIQQFNNKIKDEIKVTRRAAYGSEESMLKLEHDKNEQDEMITSLQLQQKNAQEQILLYDKQIENQKEQTTTAELILKDAMNEMEKITIESKEYMNRWKSTLISITTRDEALQQAEQQLLLQKESLLSFHTQFSGLKSAIKTEQLENEKLTYVANKLSNETSFIQDKMSEMISNKESLLSQYDLLKKHMMNMDNELKLQLQDKRIIDSSISSLTKQIEKYTTEKIDLDFRIIGSVNEQTTIQQGAAKTWKDTDMLKKEIHTIENQMNVIQNEIARIQVDTLNTTAHNNELLITLKAYEFRIKTKRRIN